MAKIGELIMLNTTGILVAVGIVHAVINFGIPLWPTVLLIIFGIVGWCKIDDNR